MAENVGGIVYNVDIDTAKTVSGTKSVNKELDNLEKGFKKADGGAKSLQGSIRQANSSFSGMGSAIKGVLAPLLSVAAAIGALRKLVDVQRQFDVLNAGLITATGSAENAAIAFDALQQFAAKTPYDLNQATKAFTQLVNLGLTPSEQALMSYGNTASAMGKDLAQMVEAVADATTGEFERLKEFGIKAKKEGDNVSITFQGVTTNIGNNAAEIEQYLIGLGENQFAGAMEQRMASLDGAISNLADTWDNTFRLIAASGAGDMIESSVRMATAALDELNAQLASGELGANIDAIIGKFDGFGRDIDQTFSILTGMIGDDTDKWDSLLTETVNSMISTFKNFPENVRALIQIMTVEVLAGFDKVTAYAKAFNDGLSAIFNSDTFEGVGARLEQQLAVVDSARGESLDSILAERDAALDSFEAQTEAADELRKSYDELNAAKSGQGDRLAGFKVGGGSTAGAGEVKGGGGSSKKAATDAERAAKAIADQVKELQLQADTLGMTSSELEIYKLQLAGATDEQIRAAQSSLSLVDAYSAQEEAAKASAKAELDKKTALEAAAKTVTPLRAAENQYTTDLGQYQAMLDAKLISDQEYLQLKGEAEKTYDEQRLAAQSAIFANMSLGNTILMDSINALGASSAQVLSGVLSGTMNGQEAMQALANTIFQSVISSFVQMGVEQVKAALIGKAASAAAAAGYVASVSGQVAANTALAAQAAFASTAAIPIVGPAAAPAAAAAAGAAAGALGAPAIGAAASTISGRALGGPVQANQMYRVNETGGPEIFNAANGRQYMMPNQRGDVVSNKDAQGGTGEPTVIVNIQNNAEGSSATATSRTDNRQTIIDVVVSDIMSNGKIGQSVNRVTGSRRAGG